MPEQEQPDDKILGDVTNLETARMTLRWALERMRGLEKANADIKDLLKQTLADREKTSLEMEGLQRLMDERLRKLEDKERFVMEMQKMLNSIFQRQLDVGEFVERRQELEKTQHAMDAKVQEGLKDLEQRKQAELQARDQRIAELESQYAQLRQQMQEESSSAFKAQSEEHTRRLNALELEYAAKRRELQDNFDLLKKKLAEEHATCPGDAHLEAGLQARWQAERERLEREIAARSQELQTQQDTIQDLKKSLYRAQSADIQESTEQLKAVRRELTEALERQREENRLQAEQHEGTLRERLQAQEQAFQSERGALLEQIKNLEALQARKEEQALKLQDLERSASEQSAEKIKGAMDQLAAAEQRYQQGLDADAEQRLAMERQFEEISQRQNQEIGQLKAELEQQKQLFQDEKAKLTQQVRAARGQGSLIYREVLLKMKKAVAEKEASKRLETEAALEEARFEAEAELQLIKNELEKSRELHKRELQELREHMDEQQAVLLSEKNVLLEQVNTIRTQEKMKYQEALEKMEHAYAERRESFEAELEAIHKKLREQQERSQQERDALLQQLTALNNQRTQEHQQALSSLEKSYREREQRLRAEAQADVEAERDLLKRHQASSLAERNALLDQIGALQIEGAQKLRSSLDSLDQSLRQQQEQIRRIADEERRKLLAQASQLPADDPRYQQEVKQIEKSAREKEELLLEQVERDRNMLMAEIGTNLKDALEKARPEQETELQQQMAEQIRKASEQYEQQLEARRAEFAKQNEEHRASLQGLREQLERWQKVFNTNQPELAMRSAQSSGWAKFGKKLSLSAIPIGLLALFIALWLYWTSGHDYMLPLSHPTGIVWNRDTLWVSDWYEQAIYQMHRDGKSLSMIRRYALPKSHVTGIALVEDKLYLVDSWTRQIQAWRVQDERLTMEKSWPSPGRSPSAVYFDGKDLWSSDKDSHRIYRHSLDDKLTILNTYPIDHTPVGFYADSERFWSADEHSRLVYRHRYDPSMSVIAAYGLKELDEGKPPLSCFTLHDGRVWLGRDGSNVLIERAWWRFKKRNLQ